MQKIRRAIHCWYYRGYVNIKAIEVRFHCFSRVLTESKQAEFIHKAKILIQLEKYDDAVSIWIKDRLQLIGHLTVVQVYKVDVYIKLVLKHGVNMYNM